MRTLLADEPPNLPLPARPSSVLAAARTVFVEGTPAPEPLVSHPTSPWLAPNLRAPARGTPSPYGNDPLPPGPPAYPSPNVPYAPYSPHGGMPPASYQGYSGPPGYAGPQGPQGPQGPTMVPPPPGYAPPPQGMPSSARQTVAALPPQAMSARARVMGMPAPQVPPAMPTGKGPPPSPAIGTPVGNPLDSPEYRAALAAFEARVAPMQQRQQAAPYAAPHGHGHGMTPRAAQMMALPTAQPQRNLGFVVVMVLCAFAAAGGYLLVHWLSTR
jgi:hypothetical protein